MNSKFWLLIALVLIAANYFYSLNNSDESDELPSILVVEGDRVIDKSQEMTKLDSTPADTPNRILGKADNSDSELIASDNLLNNGQFERSLEGWAFEDNTFWSSNAGMEEGGALIINAPEIDSESRAIYSKSVRQCIAIRNGAEFGLAANFNYPNELPARASVNRLHLIWFDSDNCSRGGQYGGYMEPSLETIGWQRLEKRDLTPALGAKSAQIKLEQRQDGNNSAPAVWDNVAFFQTAYNTPKPDSSIDRADYDRPLGENYIQNASFDRGIEAWSPKRSRRLDWRIVDSEKHQGVMSATIANKRDSSMGTGSFRQCINIGTRQRYELGAMVKVSPESRQRGGGRLRATWYEEPDCKGRYRSAKYHADVDPDVTDWQTLHIDKLVPRQAAKSVSVGIVHSIKGQGEHTLFWDDFYFRAY